MSTRPDLALLVPLCLASLAAACGGGSSAVIQANANDDGAWDGGPTDVPLTTLPITSGGQTYGDRLLAPFRIGDGGPLTAWLDTGSEGLQLLQDGLNPAVLAQIQLTATPRTEEFGSGIVATGVIALAPFSLGDRTTVAPIPIFLIQSIVCDPQFDCASESLADAESVFFNGQQGILGVGLRNTNTLPTLGSPIPQLPGHPGYAVEGLSFGGTSAILRIGPTAAELAGFTSFQLPALSADRGVALQDGTPAWDDTAIPACVTDATTQTPFCANAILDTGNVTTYIIWLDYTGPQTLASGDQVQVQIGEPAAPIASFDFQVSANPQSGEDLVVIVPQNPELFTSTINFGLTAFNRYDVAFDPQNGLVGVRSH